jgi:hypothetical protein
VAVAGFDRESLKLKSGDDDDADLFIKKEMVQPVVGLNGSFKLFHKKPAERIFYPLAPSK